MRAPRPLRLRRLAAVFARPAVAALPPLGPYKGSYSLGEFWAELTQGAPYKSYAKANPGEAAQIAAIVEAKIADRAYVLPNDVAKTRTGRAIVLALCTMPGGPPRPR